jgi:hypothetical protein
MNIKNGVVVMKRNFLSLLLIAAFALTLGVANDYEAKAETASTSTNVQTLSVSSDPGGGGH